MSNVICHYVSNSDFNLRNVIRTAWNKIQIETINGASFTAVEFAIGYVWRLHSVLILDQEPKQRKFLRIAKPQSNALQGAQLFIC